MKNILYLVILYFIAVSCSSSGGKDNIITPIETNKPPTVPTLIYPTNNLLCINNTLDFQWNPSTDSNGDALTYKVEISKDNQFSNLEQVVTLSSTSHTFVLEKGFAYYWRVKAIDSKNLSSNFSDVFSLYTEGDGVSNYAPFLPALVSPLMNSVLQQNGAAVKLEWTASDIDNDVLTFDVYLDSKNPPTNIASENQINTYFNLTDYSSQKYYWKVIVKDNNGVQTVGQVWTFTVN
jgi:hypothetical protein